MPVLLMVGSFVSFTHLLPLQAMVLQTISGSDSTLFDPRLVPKFNQTTQLARLSSYSCGILFLSCLVQFNASLHTDPWS